MLKHEPQLEHLLIWFIQMSDDLPEDAILLRLGHHFEQLVEAVGGEDLPVSLGEEQEFTED